MKGCVVISSKHSGSAPSRHTRKPRWQILLSAYRLYIIFFAIVITVAIILICKLVPHSEKPKDEPKVYTSQTEQTKNSEKKTEPVTEKKTEPVVEKKTEKQPETKTKTTVPDGSDDNSDNIFTKKTADGSDDKTEKTAKKETKTKTEKTAKKSFFRKIIDFFKSVFSKGSDKPSKNNTNKTPDNKDNTSSAQNTSGDNTENKTEEKFSSKSKDNKKIKGTYSYGEYATFSFDGKKKGTLTLQDASQYDFEYNVTGDTLSIRFNDDGHIDKYNFVLTDKALRLNGIGETQGSFVFKRYFSKEK